MRVGQEDQLSTLGLVVNIIVLWNTFYMDAYKDAALRQLRKEASRCAARMSLASPRSGTITSTCSAAAPSRCRIGLHVASCDRLGTSARSTRRHRGPLNCSNATRTPKREGQNDKGTSSTKPLYGQCA
jgi:hypothetical protein